MVLVEMAKECPGRGEARDGNAVFAEYARHVPHAVVRGEEAPGQERERDPQSGAAMEWSEFKGGEMYPRAHTHTDEGDVTGPLDRLVRMEGPAGFCSDGGDFAVA